MPYPTSLHCKGVPGICHENHMESPRSLAHKPNPSLAQRLEEKSTASGRFNHKKAGLGGCEKPARRTAELEEEVAELRRTVHTGGTTL